VTYDTSLQRLDRLQSKLNAVQEDVSAQITPPEETSRLNSGDNMRKVNAFTQLTKILQHTAEKVDTTLYLFVLIY